MREERPPRSVSWATEDRATLDLGAVSLSSRDIIGTDSIVRPLLQQAQHRFGELFSGVLVEALKDESVREAIAESVAQQVREQLERIAKHGGLPK